MKVLIYGMRGIGIETAKNLALQGVGGITIVDPSVTQVKDLGVNFFLNDDDVAQGVPRVEAILPRLQELNTLCKMRAATSLTDALILEHSALVLTQPLPLAEVVRLNELCRSVGPGKAPISFFFALAGGVSCSIFADHGDHHKVHDGDGERPAQKLVVKITPLPETNEALILYDHPAGQLPISIQSGNFLVSEVVGVNGINGHVFGVSRNHTDPVKTVRVPLDIAALPPYVSGGLITEKKLPTPYPMLSFKEKMKRPGDCWADPPTLVSTDLINFGSEVKQHLAFFAVLSFADKNGRLPRANSAEDAALVVAEAKELVGSGAVEADEVDEDFIAKYAVFADVELQAMSAFTGGVLAQEVVKCTGMFTPIPGFLHFSAPETLPETKPSPEESAPRGSRYDELAAVFGWPFVEKLGALRYFMVGSGALGCEFFKNFALTGVCCGPSGKLIVTDADRIELSNLTRQFLFREHNVHEPKSRAAAAMAKVMNPAFNVEALEMFVGPKTEDTFDDAFWTRLDGVCNALDNMEARYYVDAQCVKYEKSLLESGTMGTSGNVDTIYPHKTRTYRDGGNAAEGGGVPMCTLRNFPQITDHCIEWSRDQFALLFTKLAKNVESYLSDPAAFEQHVLGITDTAQAIFTTRAVTSIVRALANPSIGSCAQTAFDIFHFLFRDRILDLQNTFPADFRVIDKEGKDKGPFWGEKRRYPTVATFNPSDESHTSFLLSATCLFGVAIGLIAPKDENDEDWLQEYRSPEFIAGIAAALSPPEYIFCPIKTDDDLESGSQANAVKKEDILGRLFADLHSAAGGLQPRALEVADFEKDDDFNFHIAFITAAANLRCDNYGIQRTDFPSCKVIAGKIIAAIATTTTAVCGLVMLELFKVVQNKDTESFMNRNIGLAMNRYTSFTGDKPISFATRTELEYPAPDAELPEDAYDEKGALKEAYITKRVLRAYPENHSVWDKIVCSADLSLEDFVKWMQTEHGLVVDTWAFIIGHKTKVDDDDKKTVVGVSSPVYPPKKVLDPSLLPPLTSTLPEAMKAINANPLCKPSQEYLSLWRQCKASGVIPEASASADVITNTTTIREVLLRMEALGIAGEAAKTVDARSVTGLASRKFWVVPGDEGPSCTHAESGEEIERLAAIKFVLE